MYNIGILVNIIRLLHKTTGVDFAYYKRSTIYRRIQRRMVKNNLTELNKYFQFAQKSPAEVWELLNDIFIHVTSFFREPGAYDVLTNLVFPQILKNKTSDTPIRIWVPGCSTGEEAYSIAICLSEFLGNQPGFKPGVQIFATDISEQVIEKARSGRYPMDISKDVSPGQLCKYFVKEGTKYAVTKQIREMVIFSKQDVNRDPPFSKIDLISCRNLLIYLGPVLQKRMFPVFHYALNPTGYLLLGNSEGVGDSHDLFQLVDSRHKVFSKNPGVTRPIYSLVPIDFHPEPNMMHKGGKANEEKRQDQQDLRGEAEQFLLEKYSPASIIIDMDGTIVHLQGEVNKILRYKAGKPSLSIYKTIRKELLMSLQSLIKRATKEKKLVEHANLQLEIQDEIKSATLSVKPLKSFSPAQQGFLIMLKERTPSSEQKSADAKLDEKTRAKQEKSRENIRIAQLTSEIESAKEYLQSVIEGQEVTNEELKASFEEIQSRNEELQSLNEELETSKEELQASNEELATVNDELKFGNFQLARANDDLVNTFNSAKVPIVILSWDLSIRRFTPSAEKLLNLIPADIGRPFKNIKIDFEIPAFEKLLSDIMAEVKPHEMEIQSATETWYSLQIQPYKTKEGKIDGVVLAFFNIDTLKKREETIRLRALRQTALAEFGLYALQEPETLNLFEKCARLCAQTLVAEYAIVMELTANQKNFVFAAGVGWHDGLMGTTLSVGRDSPTGYALHSGHPIIIEDLRADKRFSGPSFLLDHAVVSGMSVIIQGEEKTFGVLGVYTKNPRRFTQNDCEFLQTLANTLGEAVEKTLLKKKLLETNDRLERRVEARTAELTASNTELRKLSQAIEQSPSPVIITDSDGKIEFVNTAFVQASGYSLQEVLGKTPRIVKSGQHGLAFYQNLWHTIKSGKIWHGDICNRKKTGELYWEFQTIAPIVDPEGNITHFVSVKIDDTERKKAEAALENYKNHLEEMVEKRTAELKSTHDQLVHSEKLSAIGRLSASLAHEFNNPLYGVKNVLEQIFEKSSKDTSDGKLLAMAIHECRRMTDLIKSLQNFYKPSPGIPSVIDAHEIIEHLALLMKKELHVRKITLEKKYAPDLPKIPVIADQIKQVILNLLQNAADATPEGGKITVATEMRDSNIKIHIRDTGIGIPKENLSRIFDPFFTTKSAVKGMGLGLSISYGLVKAHGGEITVQSRPGEGSVFTVTLPIARVTP